MGSSERKQATLSDGTRLAKNLLAGSLIVFPASICWFVIISLQVYHGSIQEASLVFIKELKDGKLVEYFMSIVTNNWKQSSFLYALGFAVQAIMYLVVPGPKGYGQPTPGGHVLEYNCNGLICGIITHATGIFCVYKGVFKGTSLFDNWGTVFAAANVLSFSISILALVKAYLFPTHAADRRFSGAFIYDFFVGIEHNPRLGNLDLKLFTVRLGFLMWNLMNLSCLAKQYQLYGYVTNSMILVNLLHGIYIVDVFYHEDWYLRTIDMSHDHFGFYLGWGNLVFVPFTFTIQALYLVYNPTNLSLWSAVCILLLGLTGYYIFRSSNNQKNGFRKDMKRLGKSIIWGKTAKYIPAVYRTVDGETHKSPLLISGFWGVARHFNYVGDLMSSLAYCFPCGFNHILPYFYISYLWILLIHRVYRDDARCRKKYGKYWEYYCKEVPYKMVPYIF